jgi:DNA modification methylase
MIPQSLINQIICDDCLNILPQLSDQSISLIFADPPFNNGTIYNSYKDDKSSDDYLNWCRKWFKECRRVAQRVIITPGHGNFWMWGNQIEKPWGVGAWYKPGNPSSSILGWCCWEPWLYYCTDYKALGGPDTVRVSVTRQLDTGDHPCPKPLELLNFLIKKTTDKDGIVLDPFAGSGTTCLAAKMLGRKFIGIEMDASYVQLIKRRLTDDVDIFSNE